MTAAEAASRLPAMYVIYGRPRDFPDHFVCRVWHGELAEAGLFMKAAGPDEIRAALAAMGLVNLGRNPNDDAAILEVWV